MQLKKVAVSNFKDVSSEITHLLRNELHDNIFNRTAFPVEKALEKATDLTQLKRLQFMQFHLPTIKVGTYTIQAQQTVAPQGGGSTIYKSKEQKFRIDGERYMLPPQYKHFAFPPHRDSGNYQDVLPHLIINRSTFPWERDSVVERPNATRSTGNQAAWLVLLLLTEDEAAQIPLIQKKPTDIFPSAITNTDIKSDKETSFSFLEINKGNKKLMMDLFPKRGDVEYLTHTMITKDSKNNGEDEEMAVLIGNRFPKTGEKHVVHLISIEDAVFKDFDWDNITEDRETRHLVSLYHWSFTCQEDGELGFRQTLEQKVNIAPLRMHVGAETPEDSKIKSYVERGYVPMPHYMRKGEKTVSWFHGPLVPMFTKWKAIDVTNATSADDYLQYDTNSKLLDVSYAAAWQLGRNLTLKNKRVAKQLYFWRRSTEQAVKQKLLNQNQNYFIRSTNLLRNERIEIPAIIETWVEELFELKHIPFNYLFPHPSMLPSEALLMVRVDYNWIVALIEGVLSVGMDGTTLGKKDRGTRDYNKKYRPLTGFVLRSRVVEDYPDLDYKAYSKAPTANMDMIAEANFETPFIGRKIGTDIQLNLYQSDDFFKTLEVFGKPRGRHFGARVYTEDSNLKFTKQLRAYDYDYLDNHGQFLFGNEHKELDLKTVVSEKGRLNVQELVKLMDNKIGVTDKIKEKVSNSSANFAFHMIEGTPRIRLWKK